MSLHPAIVHIPIGLLLTYSLVEVLTIWLKQKEWAFAKTVLLIFGILGTTAAVASGFVAMEQLSDDDIAEVHMSFAFTTIGIYAVLALAYISRNWKSPRPFAVVKNFILRKPVLVFLAIVGAILLTLTGSIGSIMSHGPSNFITEVVYDTLLAIDVL